MSGARAIAVSEVRRQFRRPLTWFVLAAGEGAMAVFYMLLVIRYLEHEAALRGAGVTAEILTPFFISANLSVLLATPLISMACIAGDRENGLLRFLYSAPLTACGIVIGKLVGVLSLAGAYAALIALIPLTLFWGAPVDTGVYAGNLLGFGLFTLMHVCLGVLASALMRTPLAAALMSLAIGLGLWLVDWASRLDPQATLVGSWSTLGRLRGFAQGLINSADIVYFAASSALFIGLACLVLATERQST